MADAGVTAISRSALELFHRAGIEFDLLDTLTFGANQMVVMVVWVVHLVANNTVREVATFDEFRFFESFQAPVNSDEIAALADEARENILRAEGTVFTKQEAQHGSARRRDLECGLL